MTPEWVLTASHCVVGTGVTTSSLEIKLGEHDHRVSDGAEQVTSSFLILRSRFLLIVLCYAKHNLPGKDMSLSGIAWFGSICRVDSIYGNRMLISFF